MRDIVKIFSDYKSRSTRRSKTVYSPVNTQDAAFNAAANRPYNSTTEPAQDASNSLNVIAVVDRLLFNGRLSQRPYNKSKCVLLTMFIGLTAISLGAVLLVFSPYEIIFAIKTTFTESSEAFEMWQKPPVDVFLKVYLYNITNKDEFLAGKEKLRVQQVGPYVYRELAEHADVIFNDENGTLTATPKYPLEWVPELSNGTENDILVLPNVALLSFANVMADEFTLQKMAVNLLIVNTNTNPIVEQSAKEFMFGYKSALVTLGNQFLPGWITFDKLGLIDRMYDFEGDIETVYTGKGSQYSSGVIDKYNRLNHLPQWDAPCDRVSGSSDGTKFPTMIEPNQTLVFFRKSLCRSVPMVPVGSSKTIDGLITTQYTFQDNALDNGEYNPENKCFCRRDSQCLKPGLIDVTRCYYGFPIALSYPHFYKSDPTLREQVEGSQPSQDLHETYFYINPETGIPAKVSVKMQINLALGDIGDISRCEKFSNLVIPLLWTDIEMPHLSNGIIIKLFLLLRVLPVVETVTLYLLLISGVAFITLSVCALVFIPATIDEQMQMQKREYSKTDSKTQLASSQPKDVKNKEMDVYFCSLTQSNSDCDDDVHARVPLTSSTD